MPWADRTKSGEGFNNGDPKWSTNMEQQDLRCLVSTCMKQCSFGNPFGSEPSKKLGWQNNRHIATPKKIEK
jgi:hypothetical protein